MPEGITLNPVTGEMSGTPLDRGDFAFTVQVTDNNSVTAIKTFFWLVSGDLSIVTGAIPDGANGENYNFTLQAKGGLPPYTWRVKSDTLPEGLSFNSSTGTIYGRPTTRQAYSFTVEVSDNDAPAQVVEMTYNIEILDELYIHTRTISNGRIDLPYSAVILASLGRQPYTWRIESGALPPGLRLSGLPDQATIEGAPIEVGTFVFTLEVSDADTPVKTSFQEYTVKIFGDVVIETNALEAAFRGEPYSNTIAVAGGKLPYAWDMVEGGLPTGLSLNSTTGHISGVTTLDVGQSAAFTVRVTDAGNPYGFDEREFVIHVIDPLTIETDSIQDALQKAFYQTVISGNGGVSPYTWSMESGLLPEGITLDPDTGMISGTPMECGAFNFTLRLFDAAPITNTTTHAYALNVVCCNDYTLTGSVLAQEGGGLSGPDALAGITVRLCGNGDQEMVTNESGTYLFDHLENGAYTISPEKPITGFMPSSATIDIVNRDIVAQDILAFRLWGDVNGDSEVDIADAILALQIMSGESEVGTIHPEASAQEKIGIQDAVMIIQKVSETR